MQGQKKALQSENKTRQFQEHNKDKHFQAQLIRVYNALKNKPMTMLEADKDTGVMRSNICRHLAKLRKQNKIAITRKRRCSITGYLVSEYTGNPDLFPRSKQLELF